MLSRALQRSSADWISRATSSPKGGSGLAASTSLLMAIHEDQTCRLIVDSLLGSFDPSTTRDASASYPHDPLVRAYGACLFYGNCSPEASFAAVMTALAATNWSAQAIAARLATREASRLVQPALDTRVLLHEMEARWRRVLRRGSSPAGSVARQLTTWATADESLGALALASALSAASAFAQPSAPPPKPALQPARRTIEKAVSFTAGAAVGGIISEEADHGWHDFLQLFTHQNASKPLGGSFGVCYIAEERNALVMWNDGRKQTIPLPEPVYELIGRDPRRAIALHVPQDTVSVRPEKGWYVGQLTPSSWVTRVPETDSGRDVLALAEDLPIAFTADSSRGGLYAVDWRAGGEPRLLADAPGVGVKPNGGCSLKTEVDASEASATQKAICALRSWWRGARAALGGRDFGSATTFTFTNITPSASRCGFAFR